MITLVDCLRQTFLAAGLLLVSGSLLLESLAASAEAPLVERRRSDSFDKLQLEPDQVLALIDSMCAVIVTRRGIFRADTLLSIVDKFVAEITLVDLKDLYRICRLPYPVDSEQGETAHLKRLMAVFIAKITFEDAKSGGAKTIAQRDLREALFISYKESFPVANKENISAGTLHKLLKDRVCQGRPQRI